MAAVNRGNGSVPGRSYLTKRIDLSCCFRKTLRLSGSSEKMPVRISADGRYKLYANGKLVCFGPCKGDDKRRYMDEPDLRPFS